MNIKPDLKTFNLGRKFFWRFILLFLIIYIVPYDLAFGFTEKFEEWRWWHKPIFSIGENLFGWEFDYEKPYVGWDSKFEVCRYIFIFLFGSLLSVVWLLVDYFYLKFNYEKKLVVLTQTFLRYRIAIVMLHYGLAKIFMHQFGTIDINTLESTIGEYSPMGLMWKYLSFSEEVQMFSGWIETIGAILLFFRKTTFLGAFLLVLALANVVLWDISFSVSVTLYAIQLLLLTLVLLTNQYKGIYNFLISGKTATANKYKAFAPKYAKAVVIVKIMLFIGLAVLFGKDNMKIHTDYFSNNYQWFTGLHSIETFIINNDTIKASEVQKKWKKILFNDILYLNDSFKIEYEDTEVAEERFKYKIDSLNHTITYRDYEDEEAPWNEMKYQQLDDKTYHFESVFKSDTISVKTTIKRLEDYNLISKKGNWLIDLQK